MVYLRAGRTVCEDFTAVTTEARKSARYTLARELYPLTSATFQTNTTLAIWTALGRDSVGTVGSWSISWQYTQLGKEDGGVGEEARRAETLVDVKDPPPLDNIRG